MNRITLLSLILLFSVSLSGGAKSNVIKVKAGDAQSLLQAIDEANIQNADTMSERLFVLIPNGIYDLGEQTLTTIGGHNIALVGESMEGTIIMNAPPVENEGIGKTATLLNRGWNTYVQDLTLKNALDYYHSGPAGRAVCWQDKGNRVIFKNVRMLSYQDTYYSHSETCQHYFEDSEIHGTIDFICGTGDVYFNRWGTREPSSENYDVFNAHIGRVQELLRAGKSRTDIGFIHNNWAQGVKSGGETNPPSLQGMDWQMAHMGVYYRSTELQDNGYTYDYLSPDLLTAEGVYFDPETKTVELAGYKALVIYQRWLDADGAQLILS